MSVAAAPAGSEPVEAEGDTGATAADFQVGMEVTTIARKEKDSYDNKRAQVVKVLSSKVRVVLLEGPSEGQERDFTFKCLAPPKASASPGPVAHAGKGGRNQEREPSPSGAPDAKKARTDESAEDTAARVFGDLTGM